MNSISVEIYACGFLPELEKEIGIDKTKEGCIKGKKKLMNGVEDYTACVCHTDLCNCDEEKCNSANNLHDLNITNYIYIFIGSYVFGNSIFKF